MKDLIYKTLCTIDKESSRFLNKLKNIINPLNKEELPKGFQQSFMSVLRKDSFGGTDTKIYIIEEDNNLWGMKRPPEAPLTAASFISGIEFTSHGRGVITCPVFDGMRPIHELLGKTKKVILCAANEYGKIAVLFEGIVEFDKYLTWGVSIDDIVIETHLNFTQLSQVLDLEEKE